MTDTTITTISLTEIAEGLGVDTTPAPSRPSRVRTVAEFVADVIVRRAATSPEPDTLRTLAKVAATLSLWKDRALTVVSYLALVVAIVPLAWLGLIGATHYARAALLLTMLTAAITAGYVLRALQDRAARLDHRLTEVAVAAFRDAGQWTAPTEPEIAAGLIESAA